QDDPFELCDELLDVEWRIDVVLVQLLYHLEIDLVVELMFRLECPEYSGLESGYSSLDVRSLQLHLRSFRALHRMYRWMALEISTHHHHHCSLVLDASFH